jgi:hypothetical protein
MNCRLHRRCLCFPYLMLVGVLGSALAGCDRGSADRGTAPTKSLTALGKVLASQPAPDLDRLVEEARGDHGSTNCEKAFYALLTLRETGNEEAVPVLEKVMTTSTSPSHTHVFAAAQALFCIGTPEAHEALSRHLLTSQYYAAMGFDYAFAWEMQPLKRDGFIECYHLKNLSSDLSLRIEARSKLIKEKQRIDFTVTAINVSGRAFRIPSREVYQGHMLYLRTTGGGFCPCFATKTYDAPRPTWVELEPGNGHQFKIGASVERVSELKRRPPQLSPDSKLVLETWDVVFDVRHGGRFEVWAMMEESPPTEARLKVLGFDNPWSGRAVSGPVRIEIAGPG